MAHPPGYVPLLPEPFLAELVAADTGRWRERGITHWHLLRDEQPISVGGRPNPARFDTDRLRELVNDQPTKIAYSPAEALWWLVEERVSALADPGRCPYPAHVARQSGWHTEAAWLFALRCSWENLAGGSLLTPAGGGIELRPNHSLDVHAYPMTTDRCRRH